jgi:hypothetical protein
MPRGSPARRGPSTTGLPGGFLFGLDGGMDGQLGQLAHHGRGAPQRAVA